jgi:protein-S-isoprenylcysteine O-methyltransferase Ste14
MSALKSFISVVWLIFWIYWLVSARGAKQGSRSKRVRPPALVIIAAFLLLRVFKVNGVDVHNSILEVVGLILFICGLAIAVWARINLGRNWGMPMTEKDEPELVTSGPYKFVRHPIYSGILLAVLGTSLALDTYGLIAFGAIGLYFIYSARVEEQLMTTSFPSTYPSYRAKTKMLIPFVL